MSCKFLSDATDNSSYYKNLIAFTDGDITKTLRLLLPKSTGKRKKPARFGVYGAITLAGSVCAVSPVKPRPELRVSVSMRELLLQIFYNYFEIMRVEQSILPE
jgi:hypothetical protein